MPCNEKMVKGLGEIIENVTGKIPLKKDKPISATTTYKPRNRAIKSPTYISGKQT